MNADKFQQAVGCSRATAQAWAGAMSAAMMEFGIDTPVRQAAALAQFGHESGGFVFVREIWGPTPAQERYEGRVDLGNTQHGDGFRYRGRGPIQITGRANYRACGKALGVDLEQFPEMLEAPTLGARAACWFWKSHGLNQFADSGDFAVLTRVINGGLNGYEDRVARWNKAKAVLL